MTIYLIRHGQSAYNAAFEHDGTDPMILDAPLTALGVAQAQKTRDKVADLNIRQVITTPLTRAIQTASIIFDGIAPIRVMAEHRERIEHNCDVGRPPDQLQLDFPNLSFDHLDKVWWYQGPENEKGVPVEPWEIFRARITEFRSSLSALPNEPTAIVGHNNTFRELAGYDMANCELRHFQV